MGKITGFLEIHRQNEAYQSPEERVKHYREFVSALSDREAGAQGARCMDCGIPFCHNGCPIHNLIPDWNDLVYKNTPSDWQLAIETLHRTNNFPEFTGRVCPAPCEAACTLNIPNTPVAIKAIEHAIIDRAWREGWVQPQISAKKIDKKIAVVGSGPAGLSCAQQLARMGYAVTVFEKNDRLGGLLRYGIPDFKLEKSLIDRRIAQMQAEGVEFKTSTLIGAKTLPPFMTKLYQQHLSANELLSGFDAIALTGGAESPRELPIPGRELAGVHFAMEFLPQQNRANAGDGVANAISAKGKHVVVIGGGDTGADCVGTSNRQGALSVTQLEVMPQPPESEDKAVTWPYWPLKLRTSSSHDEGCQREFSVSTKNFVGNNGKVTGINIVRVQWQNGKMEAIAGSEEVLQADLVLLAMGFVHPLPSVLESFGVDKDPRGNARADFDEGAAPYATNVAKVFAAGDMRRGQSLVVWAIREGRHCAEAIAGYLNH